MDKDINDMQCWIFRHAQVKWNISPAECALIFKKYKVFDFIADCYDILHVSSYNSALLDVELFLKNRGVKLC